MLIIPAIDIKEGACVRLEQGDFTRSTTYGDDPVAMALHWEALGAPRLHIVDLDGSRSGLPINKDSIIKVIRTLKIPVQVGGGIRSVETAREYLNSGAEAIILGTSALKDPIFVRQACARFNKKIIIGVDALSGMVALEGWVEQSKVRALDFAQRLIKLGIGAIVYTDISRDGMQTGVNIQATREFALATEIPIIASGGLASLLDIEKLLAIEADGVFGVIIGKALYTKAVSLADALALVATKGATTSCSISNTMEKRATAKNVIKII